MTSYEYNIKLECREFSVVTEALNTMVNFYENGIIDFDANMEPITIDYTGYLICVKKLNDKLSSYFGKKIYNITLNDSEHIIFEDALFTMISVYQSKIENGEVGHYYSYIKLAENIERRLYLNSTQTSGNNF